MTKRFSTVAQKTHNAEATQAAILDAAEEEFAKHGLTAARTEAIAAASGVTKTMIYYYFQDKEGLYIAMLKRAFAERLQGLQAMNLELLPPEQALEQFLHWFLATISHNPNLPTIMFYEGMQNNGKYQAQIGIQILYEILSRILESGVARGVFRSLEPKHMAVNIIGTCVFYFSIRENIKHLWANKRLLSKDMIEQHQQEVMRLVMAGVRVSSESRARCSKLQTAKP